MNVEDSFVVLFSDEGNAGTTLTIFLRDGRIQNIHRENFIRYSAICAELHTPVPGAVTEEYPNGVPRVWMTICKLPAGDDGHDRNRGTFTHPDGPIPRRTFTDNNFDKDVGCIVWHVEGTPPPDPNVHKPITNPTESSTDPVNRRHSDSLVPQIPANYWCVQFFRLMGGSKTRVGFGYVVAQSDADAVSKAKVFGTKDYRLAGHWNHIHPHNGSCPSAGGGADVGLIPS